MDKRINPFYELYVTETIGADRFVRLFSPYLVDHTLALFQPGNVVLKGVQGSGKSMLLSLLKPETRIAYAKAGAEFPVQQELRKFIGAGINLTMCGILDFGQRPIESDKTDEQEHLPIYFGDFFNYWVVADILSSIEKFAIEKEGHIADELGLMTAKDKLNEFALSLASDDCWFGYLEGIKDFLALKQRIAERITSYRAFLNFNSDELPPGIRQSKSSVGIPISHTAKKLREYAIVPKDVAIYIRIDQFEHLGRLEGGKKLGLLYKQIINKAIGQRDSRISYRIGTRRFAWRDEPRIYGTDSFLEEERDYKVVDLDEKLRRKENKRTWIFPAFAEDVFKRRVVEFYNIEDKQSLLSKVFGGGLSAEDMAKMYGGSSPQRAIQVERDWPKPWTDFLYDLSNKDLFSARLAEAWARQKGEDKQDVINNIPQKSPFPWDKQYWKKERTQHALMQIAARCGERIKWAGVDDILSLSGGNILVFVSICQHIWDTWIRDMRGEATVDSLQAISIDVQTVGIYQASTHWYEKLLEESGGKARQQFINHIGTMFYKKMYDDKAMSYPGHNGFSLKVRELDSEQDIKGFLEDAVDYGDLHDAPHTTKMPDKEKRIKWYLNPILSPYFKIPVQHTKEPMYVAIQDVQNWLVIAGVRDGGLTPEKKKITAKTSTEESAQIPLFPLNKARS